MMSVAAWGADTLRIGRALDAVRDTVDRATPDGGTVFDSLRRAIRSQTGIAISAEDVAEGAALDRAALVLSGVVDSALLDIGGQFLWIGSRGTRRMVGIADPANSLGTLGSVEMRGGSVSTASQPREAGTKSVTVLAPSGLAADAWSTVLLGVGCARALALALERVSVVCADSGRVDWTADLDGRVLLPRGAAGPGAARPAPAP